MRGTLGQIVGSKAPWLLVLWPDDPRRETEDVERHLEPQDFAEQDRAEAETFWAGRTLAMRRSARVAA